MNKKRAIPVFLACVVILAVTAGIFLFFYRSLYQNRKSPGMGTPHCCGSFDDMPPLHRAAYYGALNCIQILTLTGSNVNARYEDGWTPLHVAVEEGKTGSAELLIARGADVNAQDGYGQAPLHWAAYYGSLAMTDLLIKKGASVNIRDISGNTPLHMTSGYQHPCVLGPETKIQLEFTYTGATDGEIKEGETEPPFKTKIKVIDPGDKSDDATRVAKYLLDPGADVNAGDNNAFTPLHYAVRDGSKDLAELLISSGAQVDVRDEYERTPLFSAATKEMAEFLVQKGANVNAREQCYGDTPLHSIVKNGGKIEIAKFLLIMGARVNEPDGSGYSPLDRALQTSRPHQPEMARLLRRCGGKEMKP